MIQPIGLRAAWSGDTAVTPSGWAPNSAAPSGFPELQRSRGEQGRPEDPTPGAQWFADGSSIGITVNGLRHRFSWELDVDGATAALVGASLGDEEDAQAVIEAFDDGVATAGAAPLALTTDGRAANHTPEVEEALGDAVHLRTTPARPQNNSPVEGAFGLFAQTAPPLVVAGGTPRELARAILVLVLTTWGRATNHRPRNDRRGRSRVQLYRGEQPTEEQIVAARAALEKRRRRQLLAAAPKWPASIPSSVPCSTTSSSALISSTRPDTSKTPSPATLMTLCSPALATFEGKRVTGTLPMEEINRAAVRRMFRQVGSLRCDDAGIAYRGLCIRHLVLPNGQSASREVLAFLKQTFDPPDVFISLMAQYRPLYGADRHALIGRRVDSREYEIIKREFIAAGFEGFYQDPERLDTAFVIDFKTRKEDPLIGP